MTNVTMPKKAYDLEERTTRFSEQVLSFCQKLPETTITKPLISQIVRSTTSTSANYCEADEANSKRDFVNKRVTSKKETRETKHWLRLIAHVIPTAKDRARILWKEAHEINLIFAAIIRKSKEKNEVK